MSSPFGIEVPFAIEDLDVHRLDDAPPGGFDCGAEEQNGFLYERAWPDAARGISVTHLLCKKGILAAYLTLMADRIQLGPREKPRGVAYRLIPAVKIAQLGVDRRFAGQGLGRFVVACGIETARTFRRSVGCRYVTLDARTEALAGWYERQGFVRNRLEQTMRVREAAERGREPDRVPISMRFDLRDAREG